MAKSILAACKQCGKEFKPKGSSRGKFCCWDCMIQYNASRRAGPGHKIANMPCANCNADIKRVLSVKRNGEYSDKVFCNRACYDEYRISVYQSGPPCKGCGDKFARHAGNAGRAYCSDVCWKSSRKAKSKNCIVCGCWFSPIYFMPSRREYVGVNNRTTCSKACVQRNYRENQARKDKISKAFVGENHPNWQGGPDLVSKRRDYRGSGWAALARAIRKRDKYICQHCGVTQKEHGRALEVHHKIPFSQFRGDNQKANKPSNLVSLCKSCHQNEEWKYRRENPIQLTLTG